MPNVIKLNRSATQSIIEKVYALSYLLNAVSATNGLFENQKQNLLED